MSNPRSPLVEEFRRGYVGDLAVGDDDEEAAELDAESRLETIETFLRVNWDENARHHIREFEREHGIDFEKLAEKAGVEVPRW